MNNFLSNVNTDSSEGDNNNSLMEMGNVNDDDNTNAVFEIPNFDFDEAEFEKYLNSEGGSLSSLTKNEMNFITGKEDDNNVNAVNFSWLEKELNDTSKDNTMNSMDDIMSFDENNDDEFDVEDDDDDYDDDTNEYETIQNRLNKKFKHILDIDYNDPNNDICDPHVLQYLKDVLKTQKRNEQQNKLQGYGNEDIEFLENINQDEKVYLNKDYKNIYEVISDIQDVNDIIKLEELLETTNGTKSNNAKEEFAVPGPTIQMYDTLLDTIAVSLSSSSTSAAKVTSADTDIHDPNDLKNVLLNILHRHQVDCDIVNGGESGSSGATNDNDYRTLMLSMTKNTNIHTIPTMTTFNAVLRCIANIPYHEGNKESNENKLLRDNAVQSSLEIFDFLLHNSNGKSTVTKDSSTININSATYYYMICIINKFMPPSRSRSNILYTFFILAKDDGLINKSILYGFIESLNDYDPDAKFYSTLDVSQQWIDLLLHGKLDFDCDNYRNEFYDKKKLKIYKENNIKVINDSNNNIDETAITIRQKIEQLNQLLSSSKDNGSSDANNNANATMKIQIPSRWKRNSRKRRHNPKQYTYAAY